MLHSLVGFAFGVVAITLAVESVALAALPLWSWALPDGVQFGLWTADSLPVAALTALLAVPHAVLTVVVLRGMAALHGRLARWLLGPAAQAGPSHRDGG